MGSVIGIVLALCVGLLIFVVKDVKGVRTKTKKILFSFLSTEVLLAFSWGLTALTSIQRLWFTMLHQ